MIGVDDRRQNFCYFSQARTLPSARCPQLSELFFLPRKWNLLRVNPKPRYLSMILFRPIMLKWYTLGNFHQYREPKIVNLFFSAPKINGTSSLSATLSGRYEIHTHTHSDTHIHTDRQTRSLRNSIITKWNLFSEKPFVLLWKVWIFSWNTDSPATVSPYVLCIKPPLSSCDNLVICEIF